MKKTVFLLASSIFLFTSTTWGQDGMHFYNLALESSMANKKIHYFTKALELNPKLAAAYEMRGLLYYFQGKYSNMMEDFQRLTELEPSKPEAHLMLGLAFMKRGSYDYAVGSLTRAIELSPHLASAYGHRAETYRLKGMAQQALEDSSRALKLGGNRITMSRAYRTRAKAYNQLGKSELAHADLDEAFRLDPSFFFYLHPSSTDSYAVFVSESRLASRDGMRRIGVIGILAILFVLVFKLAMPAPKKDDAS